MARGFYPLDDKPEYQEEVERLLNSDPVRAEDSFSVPCSCGFSTTSRPPGKRP